MNRSQHILELALKNSGVVEGYADIEAEPQFQFVQVSGGTDKGSEVFSTNNEVILNELVPVNTPVVKSGTELLEFKQYLLRTRRDDVLPRISNNSESSQERQSEPFSPDVSEYVPSFYKGNNTNTMEQSSLSEVSEEEKKSYDNNEPCCSKNTVGEEIGKKVKKRSMPKKIDPGRKRKRNPTNWKNNVNKRKKNMGQEFVNQRGKLIKQKEIKPGCNIQCRSKCSEKFTAELRNKIFNEFWALGDHTIQMNFVSKCVERVPRKQVILATIGTSRRQWSYKYFFFKGIEKIQVCKKMFFSTLAITDKWVTTIYKKIDIQGTSCAVLEDRRGRHSNRPNQISEEVKATVRTHISQIPTVDSHYVRARTAKKYFEATLSFPRLYKLYKEWLCDNNYETAVSATERQYREVFYSEFNIDFFKPKKDLCSTCDIYNRASIEEKEALAINYTNHIASKFVVRELKSQHKDIAQQSKTVVVATYDLQKILTTPASEVSVFYYKRKLAVYNFTVFDIGKCDGYCYVWDETIGKKGANEISSAVYLFIAMKAKEGFKDFFFYSDNCGGQNRNRIVFAMYAFAVEKFDINITHIFYEVGHTQNEGDSMHALIERRKKHQVVYVPEQWITLIRCAKPYTVTELNQSKILNFKDLMGKQTNFKKGTDNNNIKWTRVRHLKIERSNPKHIQINYDFLSEENFYINLGQQRKHSTRKSAKTQNLENILADIPPAYVGPLPISHAKYKDLNALCTAQAIPELYRNYYENLKYGDATHEQSDSD